MMRSPKRRWGRLTARLGGWGWRAGRGAETPTRAAAPRHVPRIHPYGRRPPPPCSLQAQSSMLDHPQTSTTGHDGACKPAGCLPLLPGQPAHDPCTGVDRPVSHRPSPRVGGSAGTTMSAQTPKRRSSPTIGTSVCLPSADCCSPWRPRQPDHGGCDRRGWVPYRARPAPHAGSRWRDDHERVRPPGAPGHRRRGRACTTPAVPAPPLAMVMDRALAAAELPAVAAAPRSRPAGRPRPACARPGRACPLC
jgi:hypothetical protein